MDNLNLEIFFAQSDSLFESLHSKIAPNGATLEGIIQRLESNVPRGGEPLQVQAQSAMICLITALDALANGTRTRLSDAVAASVDAVCNYDHFVRSRLKQIDRNPFDDYPLLTREVERQMADVTFIKRFEHFELANEDFLKYRVENFQYPIPPAV